MEMLKELQKEMKRSAAESDHKRYAEQDRTLVASLVSAFKTHRRRIESYHNPAGAGRDGVGRDLEPSRLNSTEELVKAQRNGSKATTASKGRGGVERGDMELRAPRAHH